MAVTFRTMCPGDYYDVATLWRKSCGVGITDADSQRGVADFLIKNGDLSLVAEDEGRLVAAVLCGHDGRRGYISHLAVAGSHRRRGVATEMVDRCIAKLRDAGIEKCHLFVFRGNESAVAFWRETGWIEREDIATFSKFTGLDLSDGDDPGQDAREEQ
jgi:ribosomal protein S18 acetylase RimI-like enzyme